MCVCFSIYLTIFPRSLSVILFSKQAHMLTLTVVLDLCLRSSITRPICAKHYMCKKLYNYKRRFNLFYHISVASYNPRLIYSTNLESVKVAECIWQRGRNENSNAKSNHYGICSVYAIAYADKYNKCVCVSVWVSVCVRKCVCACVCV